MEGSHSGLVRLLGEQVYRKVSRVRISPLPPIFRIRILGDYCLAPPEAGLGFGKDFEGIFEVAKQFLPAQTEVRFAKGKHKFEKFINQSFFSPSAKGKAIILNILTAL